MMSSAARRDSGVLPSSYQADTVAGVRECESRALASAVLLRTKSGVPAMGGASKLSLAPADLGSVEDAPGAALDDAILLIQPETIAGSGSVTGTIGAVAVDQPVEVTN
jgi:hypothetical protein